MLATVHALGSGWSVGQPVADGDSVLQFVGCWPIGYWPIGLWPIGCRIGDAKRAKWLADGYSPNLCIKSFKCKLRIAIIKFCFFFTKNRK